MKTCILFLLIFPLVAAGEFTIPNRAKRIHDFEKAGVLQYAEALDELDQDILYFRVATKSDKELVELYPNLPLANMRQLRFVTQEAK